MKKVKGKVEHKILLDKESFFELERIINDYLGLPNNCNFDSFTLAYLRTDDDTKYGLCTINGEETLEIKEI